MTRWPKCQLLAAVLVVSSFVVGAELATSPSDEDGFHSNDTGSSQLGGTSDLDGDGIPDQNDNCVDAFNPDQSDLDVDGLGDVCDNCPVDSNFNQANNDVGDLGPRRVITGTADGAYDVVAADLDGDSDLALIGQKE